MLYFSFWNQKTADKIAIPGCAEVYIGWNSRQNKDFLRFLSKRIYSEKPTSKLINLMTKYPHTEWVFFIILNVFYLKKITLSMKSHLVSFLNSFWHYKRKKLISTKCNSKKLSYPPLLIASLIEDVTFTLLNKEDIKVKSLSHVQLFATP